MQHQEKLIILYNETNLAHKSSRKHPECPQRIASIHEGVQTLMKNPSLQAKIIFQELQEEKDSKQTQKLIEDVHGQNYSEFVKEMWHEGIKKSQMFINVDTYFMKDTFKAARQAVRTCIYGVDALLSGKFKFSFAIVRPPGHHSGMKSQPHGFSFFNNVAISTNYAIKTGKKTKIVIIDWDVHHGEGTQKLFYHRKDVLYISLHRFDKGKFFPHVKQSGSEFVGEKEGTGFNVNICWNLSQNKKQNEHTCGDAQYIHAFRDIVMPVLTQFNPEMIFVSCGFDSADGDQIGGLKLTQTGYTYLTQQLMKLNKPMFLVLEGGYNLDVLKWASQAVIRTLIRQINPEIKKSLEKSENSKANEIGMEGIEGCRKMIEQYWKLS